MCLTNAFCSVPGINGVAVVRVDDFNARSSKYPNHRVWEWVVPGVVNLDIHHKMDATPITGEAFDCDHTTADAKKALLIIGVMIEDRMERNPFEGYDNMWKALTAKAVLGRIYLVFYKCLMINDVPYHANPSFRKRRRYDVIRIWHKENRGGCNISDCWYAQILVMFNCEIGDFMMVRYFERVHRDGIHPLFPSARYMRYELQANGDFTDVLLPMDRILITTDEHGQRKPYLMSDFCHNEGRSVTKWCYFDCFFF